MKLRLHNITLLLLCYIIAPYKKAIQSHHSGLLFLSITPEMVPTLPITPAQEAQLLALIEQLQIAVNTCLNNPIPANNTALRTSLTNLYNFLLNEFPTQAGRDATRYSLFLLSTVNNRLASATPSQSSEIAVMLQSLYTTLSILISEFIMTNVVRNQILNILATLVRTTSDDAGAAGPQGIQGVEGDTGPTGPTGIIPGQNALNAGDDSFDFSSIRCHFHKLRWKYFSYSGKFANYIAAWALLCCL
ncbi:collagen-like repeat preface domain-containing protein [Bacillus cereus]|uniref:Collagen-like repeat preface domain-containing protein n=1 Tax=Bacillus cereus TaxID=1396 RepID=A0A9X7LW47_BACCE|nr:collagen-like repeat preface domain-containing protein [Bacillus cereus]